MQKATFMVSADLRRQEAFMESAGFKKARKIHLAILSLAEATDEDLLNWVGYKRVHPIEPDHVKGINSVMLRKLLLYEDTSLHHWIKHSLHVYSYVGKSKLHNDLEMQVLFFSTRKRKKGGPELTIHINYLNGLDFVVEKILQPSEILRARKRR